MRLSLSPKTPIPDNTELFDGKFRDRPSLYFPPHPHFLATSSPLPCSIPTSCYTSGQRSASGISPRSHHITAGNFSAKCSDWTATRVRVSVCVHVYKSRGAGSHVWSRCGGMHTQTIQLSLLTYERQERLAAIMRKLHVPLWEVKGLRGRQGAFVNLHRCFSFIA